MNRQTRRAALQLLGIAPASLALAGCPSFVSNIPQFVTDIELIAADLAKLLPDLAVIGVTTSTIDKVTALVHKITAIAAAIAAAVTAGGGTPSGLVSQFGSLFTEVAALLGLNVSGSWGKLIQAGSSLLPLILAAVGVVLAPRARVYGEPPTMTPDQARAALAAILNG